MRSYQRKTGESRYSGWRFMLMKRDLYQELGGFDENCFMYSDDIDLSYRMLLKRKIELLLSRNNSDSL
jgi:GT2 family glycosyltransferase